MCKLNFYVFIASALLIAFNGCASKTDVELLDSRTDALMKKISQLDSQLNTLDTKKGKSDKGFRNQYASLRANHDQLKDELQVLNGRLEEIEHLFEKQKAVFEDLEAIKESRENRLEETVTSNSNRIFLLERYLGFEKTDTVAEKPSGKNSAENKKLIAEDKLYNAAKKAFDKGAYSAAREIFQKFLKQHAASENADNAHFWIGETHYQEKMYNEAILAYQNVIDNYPKGNKVTAALLKQGLAFYNLKDVTNARLILKELINKHPKSNESEYARKKLEEMEQIQ